MATSGPQEPHVPWGDQASRPLVSLSWKEHSAHPHHPPVAPPLLGFAPALPGKGSPCSVLTHSLTAGLVTLGGLMGLLKLEVGLQ